MPMDIILGVLITLKTFTTAYQERIAIVGDDTTIHGQIYASENRCWQRDQHWFKIMENAEPDLNPEYIRTCVPVYVMKLPADVRPHR